MWKDPMGANDGATRASRQDAQALLNGGFTIHQALALVQLRQGWRPRVAEECHSIRTPEASLAFARWLYAAGVLRS